LNYRLVNVLVISNMHSFSIWNMGMSTFKGMPPICCATNEMFGTLHLVVFSTKLGAMTILRLHM
jgi:hypothetical protein